MRGRKLAKKSVNFHCNMAVIMDIKNLSATFTTGINLLWVLMLKCLENNKWLKATHVLGVMNGIADARSRFQLDRFRQLAQCGYNPFPRLSMEDPIRYMAG